MNNRIIEGRLAFTFPENCQSSKYDEWSFYRNQFNSAFGGTKAIDIVHIDNQQTWLIEVKDYRHNARTKPIDLGEEVALKVRDTLTGLIAAKCYANSADEKQFARNALRKNTLRVVLHLEQPKKHSRLFPNAIEPANVLLKLRQWLKVVDAHPVVVDQNTLRPDMNWTVEG
ncbi:MAG: hypothetical protein H6999_05145 [Hahellaceae bacterium]|nr:hypothetical protein [Hahellaceae bacterium]MCP5169123.1 hypothetical protein [Hahellaceae bacterium]